LIIDKFNFNYYPLFNSLKEVFLQKFLILK